MFDSEKGRTMHRVKTHGFRVEHRKLVEAVENGEGKYKCLLCQKIYASKQGAQLHIDKVCVKKYTPEEIVNKLSAAGFV